MHCVLVYCVLAYYVLCTVHCLLCTGALCSLYWCTVYCVLVYWCTVHCVMCTGVLCTVYSVLVYCVLCIGVLVYCVLCNVYWCTVHCLLCTGALWQQFFVSVFLTRFLLLKIFPAFYGKRILTTPFEVQVTCPKASVRVPGTCVHFVTIPVFYGEQFLAPRPTPKLGNYPLSVVRDCLFNTFAATLHIASHSYIRRHTAHYRKYGKSYFQIHIPRRYVTCV